MPDASGARLMLGRCTRCGVRPQMPRKRFCSDCWDMIRQSPSGRCARCGMWTHLFAVPSTDDEPNVFTYVCYGCAHPTYDPFDAVTP